MKERMALVLYDPEMVRLSTPPDKVEQSFVKTLETELDEYVEVKSEGSKSFIQSAILDGLNSVIDYAIKDHNKIIRMRLTGKRTIDNMIKKDAKDYYQRRIQNHANEIYSYVNGLVQRDEFPKSMFGNYKAIKQVLDLAEGIRKDEYLTDLRICATTAIPKNVLETEHVIVEPSISTSSDVTEV